ncbi:hypothetical protein I5E68_13965 [Novosphingobium sp. YJ-S2-02]|uniref:Histidine kinase/HSP90-like ATPase domain-containing protein n=1 Tax=Novosphingobium aureum TaxID=2792964 RepID=A0A931HEP5_9SPHN|nr:histidine kinase [Novosphingobium aureum]MBH0114048.1 hypothetical protein [Novosphingobium aureum]
MKARDDERRAIARDLHDVTAQLLLELDFTINAMENDMPGKQHSADSAHEIIARLQQQVRCLTYVLHPPELEDHGLDTALETLALGMAARTGIDISFRSRDYAKGRVPVDMEMALLRVGQEALMNVFKHSGSQRAEMRLHCCKSWMCLRIRDFGLGLRARHAIRSGSGVGINGMKARMAALGGDICVRPLEGGTSVTAVVRMPGLS